MNAKTVCAFGFFDLQGERSWVIRQGLDEAGFGVSLCRTEEKGFLRKLRDLKRKWNAVSANADALYVVFPGHFLMPLAWWIAKRKRIPVFLDAFLSLYDTEVSDRARLSPWHPKAWLLWFVDRLACALADKILLDTEEHKEYFTARYGVRAEKILVVPVGCRPDLFVPAASEKTNEQWTVRFYGSFIPLHGIETILRAAKELEGRGIQFEILGKGQTYPAMRVLAESLSLPHLRFLDPIPLTSLPAFINGADVCLGIFGTSGKARRVVPTKLYEVLACGKPLITARTPAVERMFRDREHLLLCSPDPKDLAAKILELKNNPALAERISTNGRAIALEKFQSRTIVEPLVSWLNHEWKGSARH